MQPNFISVSLLSPKVCKVSEGKIAESNLFHWVSWLLGSKGESISEYIQW